MKLHDKDFRLLFSRAELSAVTDRLAAQISADFADRNPLFVVVLNGAFVFASELMRRLDFSCEISFVKLASYHGTSSTGRVSQLIGLDTDVTDRHIVILEDIVETGFSITHLLPSLSSAASLSIAAMFFKPARFAGGFDVKYRGIELADDFIVGFGLDYNGLGRNLTDVYVVDER